MVFEKRKKNKKIHMDFEKLTNSFETKKKIIGYLIIYWTIFSINSLLTFRNYYYEKKIFVKSVTWVIFSDFYCIAKY